LKGTFYREFVAGLTRAHLGSIKIHVKLSQLGKEEENEQKRNTIYFVILTGFLVGGIFSTQSTEDSSTTSHLHPRKRLYIYVSPARLDFLTM
jgi:hypothetical protein